MHEFFHLIFPCANIFFVLPAANKFSDGPSLMSLRQNGFRNLQNWLPGLTRHRLKIARHHRILHDRGSVVSAVSEECIFFCFGNCLISNLLTKKNVNNVCFNSRKVTFSTAEITLILSFIKKAL